MEKRWSLNLNKSEYRELAYWVGVAQADGYFKKYQYIKRGNGHLITRYLMVLRVNKKSFPMLYRFQKISNKLFQRNVKSWYNRKNGVLEFKFSIKYLLQFFKEMDIKFSDPPKPPKWCIQNAEFFGPYLAGVIDGDGDVRVIRPSYPECAVRITSGSRQTKLINAIKSILGCSVHDYFRETTGSHGGRIIRGHSHILEFYISPKNYKFIENYAGSYFALDYKRDRIINFIKMRIKKGG